MITSRCTVQLWKLRFLLSFPYSRDTQARRHAHTLGLKLIYLPFALKRHKDILMLSFAKSSPAVRIGIEATAHSYKLAKLLNRWCNHTELQMWKLQYCITSNIKLLNKRTSWLNTAKTKSDLSTPFLHDFRVIPILQNMF